MATEVNTDDVHDSKAPLSLLEEASKHREVTEAYMNSAYNSSKTIGGIETIVKLRSNGCVGHYARRGAVKMFRDLGLKTWAKLKQYSWDC